MNAPAPAGQIRHLDRALPSWAVDAIFLGLPPKLAKNHRKLYGMCVRIAMTAQRRGWSQSAYLTEVSLNESILWRQLTTRQDGRAIPDSRAYKTLADAWADAALNLANVGMRTKEEIGDDAVELAFAWADRIAEGMDGLNPVEAAVMEYVIAETERRRMLRVTCPGREVAAFADIPHRTAARTLARLERKSLLVKHSAGKPRTKRSRGRAAIFGLADPDRLGT